VTVLALDPAAQTSSAALARLLEDSRVAAAQDGRTRLVSISLEVDALDPLAVLESIFEPDERHFYAERPAEGMAIAGAETALSFTSTGPGRFGDCQRFIADTLASTVVVGDQSAPFAGPHFFAAFAFFEHAEAGAPFPPAGLFVPRWQVGQRDGRTVAVANVAVDGAAATGEVAERVWRAHQKFRAFDYRAVGSLGREPAAAGLTAHPVGAAGGYEAAVREAGTRIDRGELEKLVLARVKEVVADRPFHPLVVLNALRQRFRDCYVFSVANGRGESFIGATPERLLRVERGAMMTEALAGSIRRGAGASEDAALAAELLHSDKDLREHRIVLASMVERLAELGLTLEFSERPGVRRLANVQHLHTPVRAVLPSGMGPLEVLARLHPTAAVGGAPRAAALRAIAELEPFARGLYAGALGWVDARGEGEFFVGLRSALVAGNRARLYAGAGIVAGSSPEKEFAETELKFRAMQDALLPA
jgi:menaquinone-specific isochorismate synthase